MIPNPNAGNNENALWASLSALEAAVDNIADVDKCKNASVTVMGLGGRNNFGIKHADQRRIKLDKKHKTINYNFDTVPFKKNPSDISLSFCNN